MKLKKLSLLFTWLTLLVSNACNGFATIQTSTPLPTTTPLPVFDKAIEPTPTQWLSYNPNASNTGCGEFIATIPIKGTEELSKEEIAQKLLEIYLEHFKSPKLGSNCRLDDFKVEKIKPGQIVAVITEKQKVDYTGTVKFAVKIRETPSTWLAGNGETAPDGWIIRKSLIIRITKVYDQYIFKLIGTG